MKQSDAFRTPPKLFRELDSIFNFFWDACCDKDNCLIKSQIPLITDFDKYNYLSYNWKPHQLNLYKEYSIFMNPPYSNPGPFIKKAWEDFKHFRVVMLLKADMSTNWFNYPLKDDPTYFCWRPQGLDGVRIIHENRGHVPYSYQIQVIPLRKRIKFYVSEEVMEADAKKHPDGYVILGYTYMDGELQNNNGFIETKNYRRVEDGIESKSCANFPSMIMIFDRREK